MTELRITVKNTSETGGTFLTPVYFGFHDGSFDIFDAGDTASAGLEALAEDGNVAPLSEERLAADADSQGLLVTGAAGPVATGEVTSGRVDVDGVSNGSVSLAAMILPSNDAFIGTDEAVQLFDADGNFLGAQSVTFSGSDVYDAGTEVNTEEDAAFLNQTAPNTGIDENGVVRLHDGFNGSEGNPEGEGDQNIIGGVNAAGAEITEAADFTVAGAEIAEIHINTVVDRNGSDGRDIIRGAADDDIVQAFGGNDVIATAGGWDEIDAGAGGDFVLSGAGDDLVDAGSGRDRVRAGTGDDVVELGAGADLGVGGAGDDLVSGGAGNDRIAGGVGNDHILGGTGDDLLTGGLGADLFYFESDFGADLVRDFDQAQGDVIAFVAIEGADTFEDLNLTDSGAGAVVSVGTDVLLLAGVDSADLSASDFIFA